jgi:hypothetical protein
MECWAAPVGQGLDAADGQCTASRLIESANPMKNPSSNLPNNILTYLK